ncbi:MAG: hypothetical protein F6K15_25395, partial [Okeania sp. SIO2B3]|nr:hypothetical protein [Okeania sp. SIO2B3]
FKTLANALNNSTDGISQSIKSLGDQIGKGMSNQANLNNSHLSVIATNLQEYISQMKETKNEIYRLTHIIDRLANK